MPLLPLIKDLESLAFERPIPADLIDKVLQLAVQMRLCIRPAGTTPRGTPMPQRHEEWNYLGELYEKSLMAAQSENSTLRIKINLQGQRLEQQRRIIKGMRETPDEF